MNAFLTNGVTAHRGNPAKSPENTIPAFISGIEIGADWIELDVRKAKDGKLVVIHDDNTGRVGDINLDVSSSTYSELLKVDAGVLCRQSNPGCPQGKIPLLSEVIALIKTQRKTRMSIQPKQCLVSEIISLVEAMDAVEWVGFNDGNLDWMTEVKSINRNIPVFWDVYAGERDEIVRTAETQGFESVVMHESFVTHEIISALHDAGISAGAWTVNQPEEMRRFFGMGIARLYTDDPELCLKIKSEME